MASQYDIEQKYPDIAQAIRDDAVRVERARCVALVRGALRHGTIGAVNDVLTEMQTGEEHSTPPAGTQTERARQMIRDTQAIRGQARSSGAGGDLGDFIVAEMEARRKRVL